MQRVAAQNKLTPSGSCACDRPPRTGRGSRIHLPAARRCAPAPFAPGTLKARRSACSTIWAAAPLGFECFLLNSLFGCKPISPLHWLRERPRAESALRAPRRGSTWAGRPPLRSMGGSARPGAFMPAFQALVFKVFFYLLGKVRVAPWIVSWCNGEYKGHPTHLYSHQSSAVPPSSIADLDMFSGLWKS